MGKLKLLPIILLVLLILPMVMGVPKTDTPNFLLGYQIDFQALDTHKFNTSTLITTHVYNISTGNREIHPTVSCRLDLFDLQGTQLISEKEMVFNPVLEQFSLLIDGGNFTKLGEMSQTIYCNSSNYGGFETNGYKITQTGDIIETPESIVFLIFLIAGGGLFLLCLYGSIKIPYRNPPNPDGQVIGIHEYGYLKVILIVFSYVLLMWELGIVRSIMYNYLFINGSYNLFNWAFNVMFAFVWPLIVVSFLLVLINYLNRKKFIKALERGVPFR